MKPWIAPLLVVVGLALAVLWLGLGMEPGPTPAIAPEAEAQPSQASSPRAEPVVIAPEIAAAAPLPVEAKTPAKEPAPEPPVATTEPESLEARWRELRRQGRWNEAAPLWEEIKARREAEARRDNPVVVRPQESPDVGDPEKGGWAPAETPRKDMLPGPLPGQRTERPYEDLERPILAWGSVSGRVVDHAGRGLGGVTVKLVRVFPTGRENQLVPYEVTTDAAGVFIRDDLPVGTYSVSVQLRGYASGGSMLVKVEADATTQLAEDVVLRKFSRLRVQVTCPTAPVADQPLALWLYDDNGQQLGRASGIADANGVVVFEDVPDEAKEFEVHGGKHKPSDRQKCSLHPGEETDWGVLNLDAK